MTSKNDAVRARSGAVDSSDPLVTFLYILLRDHLPAGTVEAIVDHATPKKRTVSRFSNGWTAQHAIDIARRLRRQRPRPSANDVKTLVELQQIALMEALSRNGGNRTKTAQDLGVGVRTVQRQMKKFGIGYDNGPYVAGE